MQCKCGGLVPDYRRDCPSCGADCGFPNVRMANLPDEIAALDKRVHDAAASTKARKCATVATSFLSSMKASKAVIARPISVIDGLIANENTSYVSFQRQVEAGIRQPEDNEFDKHRKQYEEALYPYFSDNIVFASLSLSSSGMSGYGSHAMILKDEMIKLRAAVFEENPYNFVKKHNIVLSTPIPNGFRAEWSQRDKLAFAKLHSRLMPTTKESEYGEILETDNGGSGNSDWIEVHIYGEINRNAIETVSGPMPKLRPDRVMWNSLKKKIAKLGANVVEF